MRAYIYARVSPKPKPDDTGVDRQIEVCKTMAAADGAEVIEVYADRLVSASKAKARPAFERMLVDLKHLEPGDVVYVWAPDRLYRRPVDLERMVPLFEVSGVTVRAKEAGLVDLSDEDGLLKARIYGAVAARETALKSSRVRLKHDELLAQGRSPGGGRAFGFNVGNHEHNPAEAAVVVELVERYLNGEAINALAKDLNSRGLLTPRGKAWTNTTLREILANPRIAGIRTTTDRLRGTDGETVVRGPRREVGTATWAPIIPEPTFRRVQAMLARTAKDRGRPARVYTGLVVCGRCGAHMIANRRAAKHGGWPVYSCHRPGPEGVRGCHGNSVRADLLEARLGPVLARYARDYRPPVPTVDTGDAEAVLADVAATRQALGTAVASGALHVDTAAAAEVDLRAREAQARKVLRAAVEANQTHRAPAGAGELAEHWDTWSAARQRREAPAYIQEIVVGPFTPGRKGWDPGRVGVRFHGADELIAVA